MRGVVKVRPACDQLSGYLGVEIDGRRELNVLRHNRHGPRAGYRRSQGSVCRGNGQAATCAAITLRAGDGRLCIRIVRIGYESLARGRCEFSVVEVPCWPRRHIKVYG